MPGSCRKCTTVSSAQRPAASPGPPLLQAGSFTHHTSAPAVPSAQQHPQGSLAPSLLSSEAPPMNSSSQHTERENSWQTLEGRFPAGHTGVAPDRLLCHPVSHSCAPSNKVWILILEEGKTVIPWAICLSARDLATPYNCSSCRLQSSLALSLTNTTFLQCPVITNPSHSICLLKLLYGFSLLTGSGRIRHLPNNSAKKSSCLSPYGLEILSGRIFPQRDLLHHSMNI